MARRLVLMPVLPSVTVSEAENFWPSVCSANALRMDLDESQAAPAAVAVRTRNSRRRMRPPKDRGAVTRLHQFPGGTEGSGQMPPYKKRVGWATDQACYEVRFGRGRPRGETGV